MAAAALAYIAARETPVFAVRAVVVTGAPTPVAREVRRALAPLAGTSLVALDGADIRRVALSLPTVQSVSYDRAFPHTLRVTVTAERPLAVARRGSRSWLVSSTARVVRELGPHALRSLPRVWLPERTRIDVGETLPRDAGGDAVRALAAAAAAGLPGVATVRLEPGQIVYSLRGGLEIRAGAATNLPLKLAIARKIVSRTRIARYLDVSVPNRPVAGTEPSSGG